MVFRSSDADANARRARRTGALYRERLRERSGIVASRAGRSSAADAYGTEVLYATTAELVQDGLDNCAITRPTKTVGGLVSGVPAGAIGIMSLGSGTTVFLGGVSTNPVTFEDVPLGAVDFIATRTLPGNAPDRAIVIRGLNVPDGALLPSTIDFNGSLVSAPSTATVTLTGAGGDHFETYVQLVTPTYEALLWNDFSPGPAATRPWGGLNPSVLAAGEFHDLLVFASQPNSPRDFRVSLKYVGNVSNQTIAFGSVPNPAAATQVAAGAYPRYRIQGALPAEYNKGFSFDITSESSSNYYYVITTQSFLTPSGSGFTYDFTMPDIAGLAGFPAAARLTTGANNLVASGFGFTGPGIFEPRRVLGEEFKAAFRGSTIIVP
jgi:hypothetical protein